MSRLVDQREVDMGFSHIRCRLYESDMNETLECVEQLGELLKYAMDRYEKQAKEKRQETL